MATLSIKSDQEINELLDEYGIKHGPIVDSTRPLYEKKLKEAMAKDKKVTKSSTDKTFYREEEEEVTYVTYRTPMRSEGPSGDGKPYMRSRPDYSGRDFVDDEPYSKSRPEYSSGRVYVDEPHIYNTPSLSSYSSYSKPTSGGRPAAVSGVKQGSPASSGRLIPLWVQFLVFLVVAGFLYFVFTNMESAETNPFNRIQ